jgi:3-isopropylmalate dehydrogenase
MRFNISVIPGDGVGPECISGACAVLKAVEKRFGHEFNFKEFYAGGAAIDRFGTALPAETLAGVKRTDSLLLGAVGGPKWEKLDGIRPEQALLGLRGELNVFANLRHTFLYEALKNACPLKNEIMEKGIDIMIVRELTGGIYFGKSGKSEDGNSAYDTEEYSVFEIERILNKAIDVARKRKGIITLVDKANVLESSRLWRSVAEKIFKNASDVKLSYMYIDNASMQIIRDPSQFDTIVTSNIFGDILSDEASQLAGSIGMIPSASIGEGSFGMYEPVHGSAPDIAGMDKANPIATILSAAMMLKYSFNLTAEADAIESAVLSVLDNTSLRTPDIACDESKIIGTNEMSKAVAERVALYK